MNKRKFFLLPICLLLLGACNMNDPTSKTPESQKASEPDVSYSEVITSENHTHEFGQWQVTIRPTCTEKGEETRTCACGETETQEVAALGHKWDEGVVTTLPTAEAKGVKTFTCERCQATRVEDIEKVKGHTVTFNQGDHFKVYVYKTKAYTTETPTETYSCLARDENGNAIEYDANGSLFPQVSFKIVCDEGYSVSSNNIKITGTYNKIKQGPSVGDDGSPDLPDENHFRITKIQTDISIVITAINGDLKYPEATFITNHCSVVVYKSETISDENIAEAPFYARNKTSGVEVASGGQIFFKVVPETGYVWNNGVTAEEVKVNTLPFIAQKSENSGNKFRTSADGIYSITQFNDDLSILINCIPEGGEAGLGYEVTFVTTNCHVLIYQTQDYEFTPVAPTDNKAITRTTKGDAAKYVAASDGVAEVKPQINFLIVCDEGYTVGKDNIVIDGTYNKLEQGDINVNPNIWKATKVKSDLTITITAVAAA